MEVAEGAGSQKIDWRPIIVVIMGSFMAFLNSSVVNVAIPKMMVVFGASQDSIQWVLTGYMLALGIIMPVSGYLGDTFGYKRVFVISLIIFTIGSAMSGFAWSVNSLIAFRVVQALGGGLMSPIGMALIYKVVPREKIGLVMGVFGISAMAAPAIGPTLSGYLVEYVTWRTIFFINVPIGLFNVLLAVRNLNESELIKGKLIDKWGILLSSTGLFCLLMALSKGYSKGWSSPYIVGLIFVSLVALTVFVYVELHHPEPILDLRLFGNFIFTLSLIITSIVSIGMFGIIYLIPVYMQNVLGYSAMQSGLITFPSAVVAGIMMPISGRIFDEYGARGITIFGLSIFAFSTYMMHDFNLVTPLSTIVILLMIRGASMGLVNMPAATAGMNTVPLPLIGRASAMSNVIRQVAGSFGIAVFTTIMQNRKVVYFTQLAQSVNLDSTQSLDLQNTLQSMAVSNGLSVTTVKSVYLAMISQKISLMSVAHAIDDCFLLAAAMGVIALILSVFLKDKPRTTTLVKTELPSSKPGQTA
ncbi:MAG TPA: DHA2 family efflux MFS transporter permease subunit [Syntrophomonas sp.]|nr:DHA2 family efflux MFS transporter permease subunit [Syntrophomonas sp.]